LHEDAHFARSMSSIQEQGCCINNNVVEQNPLPTVL
jgi:hypothetical protein